MSRLPKGQKEKEIQLTQRLAAAIKMGSNKSGAEIEEALSDASGISIGTRDAHSNKKTGKTFKRWLDGKSPMLINTRQQVTSDAVALGWIEPYSEDENNEGKMNCLLRSAPSKNLLEGEYLSQRISTMIEERQKWFALRSALLTALQNAASFRPNYGSPCGLHFPVLGDGGAPWNFTNLDKMELDENIQSITETLSRLDQYQFHGISQAIGWQLPRLSNGPTMATSGANRVQSESQIKSKRVKTSTEKTKSKQ